MRSGIAVYTSPGGGGAFGPRIERASFGEREVFGTGNSVVLSNGQWLGVFGEIKSYGKTAKSGGASNDLFNVPPEPENVARGRWL